jgi:hypothetical protein
MINMGQCEHRLVELHVLAPHNSKLTFLQAA